MDHPETAKLKTIGPRTQSIVSRILDLGERLEQPHKGQLVVDFAGETIRIRFMVILSADT